MVFSALLKETSTGKGRYTEGGGMIAQGVGSALTAKENDASFSTTAGHIMAAVLNAGVHLGLTAIYEKNKRKM